MKRSLVTVVMLLTAAIGFSQLNNSWIDYNKTYYKFRLAKDTLTRISQPVLAAAGLGNVPAEQFQLWRNGQQVRIYTSVPTGILSASDYIEFWGEMNDGKPDKALYRNPDYQLSERYSLETDTVSYFLTVNPSGGNLRYTAAVNNTAGNVLPADPYFMRRIEVHYRSQVNKGLADVSYQEYLFSSAYDIGEGWASTDIYPTASLTTTLQNMNRYAAGPANSVMFTIGATGNASNTRDLVVRLGSTTILGGAGSPNPMPYFTYHKDTVRNLPLSLLSNPSTLQVVVGTNSAIGTDRIAVSCLSVTYPATFNFNNLKNFYFELKDNTAGNYLVITNFNNNGVAPVLYDYNNGRRYLGDISTPGQVKFALPASTDTIRRFNLMSADAANINQVTSLTSKTFQNFANTSLQGDYIIISHPSLYNNGSGVNYVDQYRQYRASATGGGFNAKIYSIDELNDQFGFGIVKHPAAIRDFMRYAVQGFAVKPKYLFIIGRGVSYLDYVTNPPSQAMEQMDLVQSFGWPASDILLVAEPGTLFPTVPVGRLGAITGNEVGIYLDKMKQYEQAQQSPSQTIAAKGWMKNMMHTLGPSNTSEEIEFSGYTGGYKQTVEDTLYGAHVETFTKTSVVAIEQQQSQRISELFQEGLSYIKYFGHSSANELAINLNYPENYQNNGKYPFMHVSGCTVGNFFTYSPARVNGYSGMSLSEKYVLLDRKGSIGFLGSTHFGVGYNLNIYNEVLYDAYCHSMYGNTIGNQIQATLQQLGANPGTMGFIPRIHLEEVNLHGDPALRINAHAKPDYVIEDQLVKFTPNIITVADGSFKVDVKYMNIGRAIRDSIRVTIRQKLPDGTIRSLYNQKLRAAMYMDSMSVTVPINPITDKGLNKLLVDLDVDGKVDELSEMNNSLSKDFYIFEDELRPISPYNYSIVNQQNISFYASTANPLSGQRQYVMEVDTTDLFNSAFKKSYTVSGIGGVIQFTPGNLTFTDSTVYYWRTSTVPTSGNNYIWNTFSFIYMANGTPGFNQSHYYQFRKNTFNNISLDNDRVMRYTSRPVEVNVRTTIYPVSNQGPDYSIRNDGIMVMEGLYGPLSINAEGLRFYILDTATQKIWVNQDNGVSGQYGSVRPVPINPTAKPGWFQFKIETKSQRDSVINFLTNIVPNGHYVVLTNCPVSPFTHFPAEWQNDTLVNGSGNSLYHLLRNAGFSKIDSVNIHRPYVFVYKKGTPGAIVQTIGLTTTDKLDVGFSTVGKNLTGDVLSDKFGPARSWSDLHWRGSAQEPNSADSVAIELYGVDNNNNASLLARVRPATDTSLGWINAASYPYLRLKMLNTDSANATPNQLRYWRVNGTYIPEGAVAPNILFVLKDTCDQGEVIDFKLAFKNISAAAFADSMQFNMTITNSRNGQVPVTLPKGKVLVSGDTLLVSYKLDTRNFPGSNVLFLEVNPNNAQPEQYHFNNVLFKELYVRPDNYNPLLDVTFDGVHILNRDIVSAKPHILINLKDESRFLALSDTSLIKVQVRFPDGTLKSYAFGDSLKFTPANLSNGNNTAVIDFLPYFPEEGEYELIVSGKDVVGNTAGALDYHISFQVITKAMISNMLNYPNPFTTSTAFVFTITGSEVPQNIRIQILTITGKIVREITKEELGPLHVGTNITEFKWDGTDMYGAKLANGVYLYRVITNLNGKSLDKYRADGDNTDKFFNKGYGKMVLIR
ncbi:MAG: C25 family cysteine peptidase [Ferruginibacter sp.]